MTGLIGSGLLNVYFFSHSIFWNPFHWWTFCYLVALVPSLSGLLSCGVSWIGITKQDSKVLKWSHQWQRLKSRKTPNKAAHLYIWHLYTLWQDNHADAGWCKGWMDKSQVSQTGGIEWDMTWDLKVLTWWYSWKRASCNWVTTDYVRGHTYKTLVAN